MSKKVTHVPACRAEFTTLRGELAHVLAVVEANANAMEAVRRDCGSNLRRCGELQAEIDNLRKLLARF